MKILLPITVLIVSFLIGFSYKRKFYKTTELLKVLLEFQQYLNSNILIFKSNIYDIIHNYKITHENKSAIYEKLFVKSNNFYQINDKFIFDLVGEIDTKDVLINYYNSLGSFEYLTEVEKGKQIEMLLEREIHLSLEKQKSMGDLWFKVIIGIGAMIAIALW
ncbi:MAG: hypothetical protein IJ538_01490 [Clostridia bacterium]|nr:hypothetical protein [Clostridia bacterium]